MEKLKGRIEGVVFGTAIGDALGYPVEFLSLEDIRKRHGRVEGFVQLVPPLWVENGIEPAVALYSDDTQMFIAVAEGLLDSGTHENLEVAARGVADRLIRWVDSPENNRSPGGACIMGCRNLGMGLPWRTAGKPNGGGCGAAMRSMAQGIWCCYAPCQAAEWAGEMALMTHRLPMAQASAAAVAAIVAALLMEARPYEAATRGIQAAERYDVVTARMLRSAVDKAELALPKSVATIQDMLAQVLDEWRGWSGHEAVAASLFCFLLFSESYQKTVTAAVNSSGDSDSLGAIAGAFSGAYLGVDRIPAEWRLKVENSSYLRDLSYRLFPSEQ
jgi:ADP-ribosylglycohydrolase